MPIEKKQKIEEAIVDKLEAKPVRIIPYDLGCPMSKQKFVEIGACLQKNYAPIELSGRISSILIELCAAVSLNPAIECYIFQNGIFVCVVLDEQIDTCESKQHFSIDYCTGRKGAHKDIFEWKHPTSQIIYQAIEELRSVIHVGEANVRPSGLNSFENKGMSYVMTLSLFRCEKDQIYDWANLPGWL